MRESVIAALATLPEWDLEAAQIGERAQYKCEYCDLDLLKSVESYKLWEKDHIIPVHRKGSRGMENLALACLVCNSKLKGRWDPREWTSSTDRADLIAAVRKYVQYRREQTEEKLRVIRQIVREETRAAASGNG